MSRHSKNNTANSVFTYHERQKLKEYGTVSARLGQDSMKAFDKCTLCLQKVQEPYACAEGHIFCKECLLGNVLDQQKRIKSEEEEDVIKKARKEVEEVKKEEAAHAKRLEEFERNELKIGALVDPTQKSAFNRPEEDQKAKTIAELKAKRGGNVQAGKEELVKTSFWVPETTPTALLPADQSKKDGSGAQKEEKRRVMCPGSKPHPLKMKQIYKCDIRSVGDRLICHACQKDLVFQKIAMIRTCGHVMCKSCIDTLCKDEICLVCSQHFRSKLDVIELETTGSSFTSHNDVEAKKYTPAFHV